jgi:hypothetical protein
MDDQMQGGQPVVLDTTLAYVLAIATVFCACLPGGIVSIMMINSAKTKAAAGDAEGAQAALKNSYICSGICLVLGVPILLFYLSQRM